ncbi:MAG: hypothetical protein WBB01_00465 [Phormidesmis sp.]
MIGGIFETIGRTLGVGKEKYFLELDDAAEESVENAKAVVTKTAKAAVETVKGVSADVVDKVQSVAGDTVGKAESVAEDAADKAESVADKTKKAAKTAKAPAAKKATAQKAVAKGASQKSEGSEQTDAPAPAKSEPRSAEDIIVEAIAAAGKKTDEDGNVADGPHTFATDHLMPLGNRGRRRPGPSLSAFKGMAKEVNPRLNG